MRSSRGARFALSRRAVAALAAVLVGLGPAEAAKEAPKKPAKPEAAASGDGPREMPAPVLPSVLFAPLLAPMPPAAPSVVLDGPTYASISKEEAEVPGADPVYAAFQRGLWLRAFALAVPRAEQGDAAAMTMLGTLYETGIGVKIDQTKAAEWYRLAADRGDREAAAALGQMYVDGRGVKRDVDRARELFTTAAAKDQPVALFNLAMMKLEGYKTPRDPAGASDLLRRAAAEGNVEAQYTLASLLSDAQSTLHDPAEAAKWMREAAMAGFEAAEVEFALMLANGRGVEKNLPGAWVWFHRSALRGNAIGRNRLARMYAVGLGVEPDPVEAWKWHTLAKHQGLPDVWLETRLADMSDAERKRAEAMADAIERASGRPPALTTRAEASPTPGADAPARP